MMYMYMYMYMYIVHMYTQSTGSCAYLGTLAHDLHLEGLHTLYQRWMVEWNGNEMGDTFTNPTVPHDHIQATLGMCYRSL